MIATALQKRSLLNFFLINKLYYVLGLKNRERVTDFHVILPLGPCPSSL